MIIFIHGENSYRRNRVLRELSEAYTAKYGVGDILSVDLEDNPEDWKEVRRFLTQTSLFVQSKLAIIKHSGAVDEASEKDWIRLLKSQLVTQNTFLIISDPKKPRKAFSFLLSEKVKQHECPELSGPKLTSFVAEELRSRSLSLSPDASAYLLKYLSSKDDSAWVAVNELDKLKHAKFPEPVKLEDLKKLVFLKERSEVPNLAAFLARTRDLKQALPILERFFLQKDAPTFLFNSLPYHVYGRDIERLADYDLSIKKGGLDYEEALLDFVLSRAQN